MDRTCLQFLGRFSTHLRCRRAAFRKVCDIALSAARSGKRHLPIALLQPNTSLIKPQLPSVAPDKLSSSLYVAERDALKKSGGVSCWAISAGSRKLNHTNLRGRLRLLRRQLHRLRAEHKVHFPPGSRIQRSGQWHVYEPQRHYCKQRMRLMRARPREHSRRTTESAASL